MLSQLRTMWEIFKHTFTKADTVQYPEETALSGSALSRTHCADP